MNPFTKKYKTIITELEEANSSLVKHATEQEVIISEMKQKLKYATSNHYGDKTQIANLKADNDQLRKDLALAKEPTIDNVASVKLVFDHDNYQLISPTITINEDTFEQLFKIRAIDDTQSENTNAIRLSLLNLAREALEQICEDFMGDIE